MSTLTRRRYVSLLAGTCAALAGCASIGSSYDRVVDMVDEAGCDPTGSEPCDDRIREAAGNGTLLRFPRGTYRLAGSVVLDDVGRVGIVGDGNVRFRPPDGFAGKLLNIHAGRIELRRIDVDNEAPGTAAGLRLVADQELQVSDIRFHGRGLHSGGPIAPALSPAVTNPDGSGLVKNVVDTKGSAWAHYNGAEGRIGIHVGGRHRGTLRIVDCELSEFGNNGIYANDNTGDVQVVGGVYRNNNVSSIRIGGAGSFVDGALIEVDPAKYTGPRTKEDRAFNMRGVVIAQKPEKWGWKDAGVEIRNCEIRIAENPSGSSAGIHAWPTARTVAISDTTIRMDEDNPAIRRDGQRNTPLRRASSGERWLSCTNVLVSGSATGSPAIRIQDADGSEFLGSRIYQTGRGSDGISFENSTNCVLDGGHIETTRYPIHIRTTPGFVVTPDECMVTFKHRPQLRTTQQRLAAIRAGEGSTTTLPQDPWLASEQCLDARTLGGLIDPDSGDGIRNIAIAGTGNRSLVVSTIDLPRG